MYNQRDMTTNMLVPLRHYRNGNHLVTNAKCDPAEELWSTHGRIPAGRCMHLTNLTDPGQVPIAKLGCGAQYNTGFGKIPVYIYRDSDSYSVKFDGPNSTTALGPSWATGAEEPVVLMFVGLEGFELATTEYVVASGPYKVGQFLRSSERTTVGALTNADAPDIQNVAGKLSPGLRGTHTIVGLVSPGVGDDNGPTDATDTYGNLLLSFYTTYRPV